MRTNPSDVPSLYDPRQGGDSIQVGTIEFHHAYEPARSNCFQVFLVDQGTGVAWIDATQCEFGPDNLLFAVPYQHLKWEPDSAARLRSVQFHANFLCVETFHAEVGCSGALFNDPYGLPVLPLNGEVLRMCRRLFSSLVTEQARKQLAYREAMLLDVKRLLIVATRHKSADAQCNPASQHRHPLLGELRELIEKNFRLWHSPTDYAAALHVTPKSLGRIVREHMRTTLTELVRSRVLIHAKWQLLHTLRPVKEIARELGFRDELYFSRMFKKATGCSPTYFREFETEIRGGSNLSMFSSPAPILPHASISDA